MLQPLAALVLLLCPARAAETVLRSTQPVGGASIQALTRTLLPRDASLQQERLDRFFTGAAGRGQESWTPAPPLAAGASPKTALSSAGPRRKNPASPPRPAENISMPARESLFRRFIKRCDAFEDSAIRATMGFEPSRGLVLKLLGTENTTLYRGIDPQEMRLLAQNAGSYDPRDPKNSYKFATPNREAALGYARKNHGYVMEIETDQAVPYYKLSRFWNGKGWDKSVREYLILVTGKEKIKVQGAENEK